MQTVRVFAFAAATLAAMTASAWSADPPPGAASCSGCHPATQGVASPVPRLNGRDAAQIVTAMTEFRTGKRPDGSEVSKVMPFKSLGAMNDNDVDALHAFLKTLPPRDGGSH